MGSGRAAARPTAAGFRALDLTAVKRHQGLSEPAATGNSGEPARAAMRDTEQRSAAEPPLTYG
jgi:hypothetical protein